MTRPSSVAGLNLAALTGIVGFAFSWWIRAPVLDVIDVRGWLVIAMVVAAVIGGTTVALIKAWLLPVVAIAIGLILGVAWAEFSMPNDVAGSLFDHLIECFRTAFALRREIVAISGAAALAGGVTQLAVHRLR